MIPPSLTAMNFGAAETEKETESKTINIKEMRYDI